MKQLSLGCSSREAGDGWGPRHVLKVEPTGFAYSTEECRV